MLNIVMFVAKITCEFNWYYLLLRSVIFNVFLFVSGVVILIMASTSRAKIHQAIRASFCEDPCHTTIRLSAATNTTTIVRCQYSYHN